MINCNEILYNTLIWSFSESSIRLFICLFIYMSFIKFSHIFLIFFAIDVYKDYFVFLSIILSELKLLN